MSEIVKLTEFMISIILPTLETTRIAKIIIDVIQNYSYTNRDWNIEWCLKHYALKIV